MEYENTPTPMEPLPVEPRNPNQAAQVLSFSSEHVEYYTPPEYIEAARATMGGIDTDPASCRLAQNWIKAQTCWTKEGDGLTRNWWGRVWLNPPYGRTGGKSSQATWAAKLIEEVEAGHATCGILLVRASLGYNWWEELADHYPCVLTRDRIRFIVRGPDGEPKTMPRAKQAHSFFLIQKGAYATTLYFRFWANFKKYGRILDPPKGAAHV